MSGAFSVMALMRRTRPGRPKPLPNGLLGGRALLTGHAHRGALCRSRRPYLYHKAEFRWQDYGWLLIASGHEPRGDADLLPRYRLLGIHGDLQPHIGDHRHFCGAPTSRVDLPFSRLWPLDGAQHIIFPDELFCGRVLAVLHDPSAIWPDQCYIRFGSLKLDEEGGFLDRGVNGDALPSEMTASHSGDVQQ
jgi:hypothetical protein